MDNDPTAIEPILAAIQRALGSIRDQIQCILGSEFLDNNSKKDLQRFNFVLLAKLFSLCQKAKQLGPDHAKAILEEFGPKIAQYKRHVFAACTNAAQGALSTAQSTERCGQTGLESLQKATSALEGFEAYADAVEDQSKLLNDAGLNNTGVDEIEDTQVPFGIPFLLEQPLMRLMFRLLQIWSSNGRIESDYDEDIHFSEEDEYNEDIQFSEEEN